MRGRMIGCAVVMLAGVFWAGGSAFADPSDLELDAASKGVELCGHVIELAQAREALGIGDRETALKHLKEARRLLEACEPPEGEAMAAERTHSDTI